MKAGTAALLLLAGAGLDLASKAWARAALEPCGAPIDFLPFVSLRLSFNEGVSFSMFAASSEAARFLLLSLTGFLTIILGVAAYRSQGWQRVSLSVIVAGALGNLIDRAARGPDPGCDPRGGAAAAQHRWREGLDQGRQVGRRDLARQAY